MKKIILMISILMFSCDSMNVKSQAEATENALDKVLLSRSKNVENFHFVKEMKVFRSKDATKVKVVFPKSDMKIFFSQKNIKFKGVLDPPVDPWLPIIGPDPTPWMKMLDPNFEPDPQPWIEITGRNFEPDPEPWLIFDVTTDDVTNVFLKMITSEDEYYYFQLGLSEDDYL